MKRVATATVIRGNGDCQVYINGVVSAEMKRQQAMMRTERERARMVEVSRDKLLSRSLEDINRRMHKRKSPLRLVWELIVDTWSFGWALLICWPEMAGLTGSVDE